MLWSSRCWDSFHFRVCVRPGHLCDRWVIILLWRSHTGSLCWSDHIDPHWSELPLIKPTNWLPLIKCLSCPLSQPIDCRQSCFRRFNTVLLDFRLLNWYILDVCSNSICAILGKMAKQIFFQNGPIQPENWLGCIFRSVFLAALAAL